MRAAFGQLRLSFSCMYTAAGTAVYAVGVFYEYLVVPVLWSYQYFGRIQYFGIYQYTSTSIYWCCW